MQALILAAGMGTRLAPLTERSTKCMVRLHDRHLIEYLLDGLLSIGITRVILVVGHGADELRTLLGSQYQQLPIEYIENPDYRTTNNIYSLALAAQQLCAADTLLIESDLIVDPGILEACANDPAPIVAAVAHYQPWMDGTVALLNSAGSVVRFIPKHEFNHDQSAAYYKTVNIYKLSQQFSRECFLPQLDVHLQRAGSRVYYEEVFGQIVSQMLAPIKAVIVDGARWYEIDTADDLRIAEQLFRQ